MSANVSRIFKRPAGGSSYAGGMDIEPTIQPDAQRNPSETTPPVGDAPTSPASGAHTTDGTPHGYTAITPFLALANARGAVEFYTEVFGATVRGLTEMGELVVHAELDFGNGILQLGEQMAEYGIVAPPEGDTVQYSLAHYCPDVDAVLERAVAAGATVREPAAHFASGDRYASIRDPFNVRWSIMTRVEDLSPEESERRVNEWMAAQGG